MLCWWKSYKAMALELLTPVARMAIVALRYLCNHLNLNLNQKLNCHNFQMFCLMLGLEPTEKNCQKLRSDVCGVMLSNKPLFCHIFGGSIEKRVEDLLWVIHVLFCLIFELILVYFNRIGRGTNRWGGFDTVQAFAMLSQKDVVILTAASNNHDII